MALSPVSGPSNLSQGVGAITGGVDDFLRAASGVLALQNAKRQQAQDSLKELGAIAHTDPSKLNDPRFLAVIQGLAGKAGVPGGAHVDNASSAAGILGLPSISDVFQQPGVLGSLEESEPGAGRTAGAQTFLGRPLSAGEEQQVQALPRQLQPAQQVSLSNSLDRGITTAEANAAKYGNPNILIDYLQRSQPMMELAYGKVAADQMINTKLADSVSQLGPLQISQLEKNKVYSKYLAQRGVDLEATRQARISDLLSRSTANNARASYLNLEGTEVGPRIKEIGALTSYFDGKGQEAQANTQQLREQVTTYLQTGMVQGDVSKMRADYMSAIRSNQTLLAQSKAKLAALQAKPQSGLNQNAANQQAAAIKTLQNSINDEQNTYNSDVQALNALNAQFARGIIPAQPTQPTGGQPALPAGAAGAQWKPSADSVPAAKLNGKEIYLNQDGTGYVYADGTPAQ